MSRKHTHDDELAKAEEYIRNGSNGIRNHYNVQGVQDILRGNAGNQGRIANITDDEVQDIRRKLWNGR